MWLVRRGLARAYESGAPGRLVPPRLRPEDRSRGRHRGWGPARRLDRIGCSGHRGERPRVAPCQHAAFATICPPHALCGSCPCPCSGSARHLRYERQALFALDALPTGSLPVDAMDGRRKQCPAPLYPLSDTAQGVPALYPDAVMGHCVGRSGGHSGCEKGGKEAVGLEGAKGTHTVVQPDVCGPSEGSSGQTRQGEKRWRSG